MEATALLTYMATLAALTLAPGPLVAVLAARSANADRRGACALALGICAGDILVLLAVSVGFGLWLQAHPEIFSAVRYFGAVYLLWLAWRMWRQADRGVDRVTPSDGPAAAMLAGLAICLSSPQTIALYIVLLPGVVDPASVQVRDAVILIFATVLVLFSVFLAVILLAATTQKLLQSPKGKAVWARFMAATVALSAMWILFW